MMRPARHAAWLVIASACLAACNEGGGSSPVTATASVSTPPPASNPAPVNGAPVITIQSQAMVVVGKELKLRPSASDPDGNSLSFSISNKPTWLGFSAQTGEIGGTPAAADVGTYENVQITVSDGQAQASVTISISVVMSTTGRATVSWIAPTQRTDGSPLTDLAGFRVYYGTMSGDLNQVVEIRDPGARSWTAEDLTPGLWYFEATAFDQSGVESARSNTGSKTIA